MNQRFGLLDTSRSCRCRPCGKGVAIGEERIYDNVARCPICVACAIKLGYNPTGPDQELADIASLANYVIKLEARVKKLEEISK